MALPLIPILTQLARTLVPVVAKQLVKQVAKQGTKQVVKKTVQQTAKQTSKQVVKGPKNPVGGDMVKKFDSLQKEKVDPFESLTKSQKSYKTNQKIQQDQNSQLGKYRSFPGTYGLPKNNIFPR